MSAILQRELAEILADRWPREPDIDRIATASGLPLGEIARFPRPSDHWSAAVAKAIDLQVVARLIANAEFDEDVRRRFAALDKLPPAGERPVSLGFTLEWDDVTDDNRTRPWLVETGGTTRKLTAEVRVYGGPPKLPGEPVPMAPTLRWRRRRVLGLAAWEAVSLMRLGQGETAGFSVWRADTHLKIGSLQTWRIDAMAAVGDQRRSLSRLLVPVLGTYVAALVGVLLLGFVAYWLSALPDLTPDIGLSGAVIAAIPVIVQKLVIRGDERGPLWGLGVMERATVASLFAAGLLISVSRASLVIVESLSEENFTYLTRNKEVQEVKHGRKTVWRWKAPGILKEERCVCRAPGDPACSCEAQSENGIPVLHLQCRQKEWDNLPPSASPEIQNGATISAGRVWLKLGQGCEPTGAARLRYDLKSVSWAAGGEVMVQHPWSNAFGKLGIFADAVTPRITIFGSQPLPVPAEVELMRLEHVPSNGPVTLPVLDPKQTKLRIQFHGGKPSDVGDLHCQYEQGAAPTDVRLLVAPVPVDELTARRSGAEAQWKPMRSAKNVRLCVREGAGFDELIFKVSEAKPGTRYEIPDWLPHKQIILKIGDNSADSISSSCPAAQVSVIRVDKRFKAPITTDGPARWYVDPKDVAGERIALLCNPPSSGTKITVSLPASADTPKGHFMLDDTALQAVPDPKPSICRFEQQNYSGARPVFNCPKTCTHLWANTTTTSATLDDYEDVLNRPACKQCTSVCKC